MLHRSRGTSAELSVTLGVWGLEVAKCHCYAQRLLQLKGPAEAWQQAARDTVLCSVGLCCAILPYMMHLVPAQLTSSRTWDMKSKSSVHVGDSFRIIPTKPLRHRCYCSSTSTVSGCSLGVGHPPSTYRHTQHDRRHHLHPSSAAAQ